jgi:hypothetical protein
MMLLHRILRDASPSDVEHLLRLDQFDHRLYDFATKSILDAGALPWPILWLASRFNKKHALCSRKPPAADTCNAAFEQFARKLRWRYVHRNDDQDPTEKLSWRVKGVPTPECNSVLVAPELNCWLEVVRSTVLTEVNSIRVSCRDFANTTSLFKFACTIIKEYGFSLVSNDKEPGMCLVTYEDMVAVHAGILHSSDYRLLHDVAEVCPTLLTKQYIALSYRVAKTLKCDRTGVEIRKSLRIPRACIISNLATTVKTHKPQGAVEHRNLHCIPKNLFGGLGLWVNSIVYEYLNSCPYFF